MGNSIAKFFSNKVTLNMDDWQVCKHCGGVVIFIMPKWWEEMIFNKLGKLYCKNCGFTAEY